jgi:D-amino-acid dehydrogenase
MQVTGWHREGNRLTALQTTRGEIAADEFILAGGAWSPELFADLGLRIPMQAGKGYSVTVPSPVQRPRLCSIFTEARVAVTPMGDALRFGGTMEIAGMNERINPRRVAGILRAVPNYFPRFRAEHFDGLKPWCGLRPCSPDGLPYLGRTRAAANLIVATGHAMMGLSLSPVTGQLVGQLVDGEAPRFDLGLLDVDRYA